MGEQVKLQHRAFRACATEGPYGDVVVQRPVRTAGREQLLEVGRDASRRCEAPLEVRGRGTPEDEQLVRLPREVEDAGNALIVTILAVIKKDGRARRPKVYPEKYGSF